VFSEVNNRGVGPRIAGPGFERQQMRARRERLPAELARGPFGETSATREKPQV
jgi:hypothetical protein